MRRPKVRIGTLMLLIVIAALSVALIVERWKSAALLAEVQAERSQAREMAARSFYESRLAVIRTKTLRDEADAFREQAKSKPR